MVSIAQCKLYSEYIIIKYNPVNILLWFLNCSLLGQLIFFWNLLRCRSFWFPTESRTLPRWCGTTTRKATHLFSRESRTIRWYIVVLENQSLKNEVEGLNFKSRIGRDRSAHINYILIYSSKIVCVKTGIYFVVIDCYMLYAYLVDRWVLSNY